MTPHTFKTWLFGFLFLSVFNSCSNPSKNPLIGLKEGVWTAVDGDDILIPFQFQETLDSVMLISPPIWLVDADISTLMNKGTVLNVNKITPSSKGVWNVSYRNKFNTWSLNTNITKDTLSIHIHQQKQTIHYVYTPSAVPSSINNIKQVRDILLSSSWKETINSTKRTFVSFEPKKDIQHLNYDFFKVNLFSIIVTQEEDQFVKDQSYLMTLDAFKNFYFLSTPNEMFLINNISPKLDTIHFTSLSSNKREEQYWVKETLSIPHLDSLKNLSKELEVL